MLGLGDEGDAADAAADAVSLFLIFILLKIFFKPSRNSDALSASSLLWKSSLK